MSNEAKFCIILKNLSKRLQEVSSILQDYQLKFKEIKNGASSTFGENLLVEFEEFVDTTFENLEEKRDEIKKFVTQFQKSNINNCNIYVERSKNVINGCKNMSIKNTSNDLILKSSSIIRQNSGDPTENLLEAPSVLDKFVDNKLVIDKPVESKSSAILTQNNDERGTLMHSQNSKFTQSERIVEADVYENLENPECCVSVAVNIGESLSNQNKNISSGTFNSNSTCNVEYDCNSIKLNKPSTSFCQFDNLNPQSDNNITELLPEEVQILASHGFSDSSVAVKSLNADKLIKKLLSKKQTEKRDSAAQKLLRVTIGADRLLNNIDNNMEEEEEDDEIEDNNNGDSFACSPKQSFRTTAQKKSKSASKECSITLKTTRSSKKTNVETSLLKNEDKSFVNNVESNVDDDEEYDEDEEDEEILPRRETRSKVKDKTDFLLRKKVVISSDEEEYVDEEDEDEDEDEDEEEEEEEENDEFEELWQLNRKRKVSSSSSSTIPGTQVNLSNSDVDMQNDSDEDIEVLYAKPSISNFTKTSQKKLEKIKTKKKPKRRRIAADSDEERSLMGLDVNDEVLEDSYSQNKNLKAFRSRKMMSRKDLAKSTIDAEKAENERRKRLQEKQKEFNGIELSEDVDSDKSVLAPRLKSLTFDKDENSEPPIPVKVHQSLVNLLKPHQAEGLLFMYNCAFESIERMNNNESHGGILAHCMGLGKTFQVIAFLHTILTHPKLNEVVLRVMIVGPKNVTTNWAKEFSKWLANIDPDLDVIKIYELSLFTQMNERLEVIKKWFNTKKPAALIISYEIFRILTKSDEDDSVKKGRITKEPKKKSKGEKQLDKLRVKFREYLQNPGPDLVICDEGHKLKSDDTAIFKTMSKIQTRRRLCLTGTPMQNNLKEYYTMISFVKAGLLGTKAEFANRFSNIIFRGQDADATALEVRCMKRRCHVLYDFLRAVVHRRDYRVLVETIPPKQEYVIYVRLTDRQCQLYRTFLEKFVDRSQLSKRVLPDYYIFSRIWTHPFGLILHERDAEKKRLLQDDSDFVTSGSEDESKTSNENSDILEYNDETPVTSKYNNRQKKNPEKDNTSMEEPLGWYSKLNLVSNDDEHKYELGNKLVLLTEIIKKCEEIGDKLLVFSQSLESLRIIRNMLTYLSTENLWFVDGHEALRANGEEWTWVNGIDFLVIDGSVSNKNRDFIQGQFNDPLNLRARLMLVSTLAGSLGTNLVTANRVVIFDACWNPSHDTQAMFRVYRYGQLKPVYIYRFIAQGTMEERIYKRQVTKESTAKRVTEEAQIQRHFTGSDLYELYEFNPIEEETVTDSQTTRLAPPKDRLLADVILSHGNTIVSYFQHDSLFDEIEEEKLTDAERKEAWEDFELEKNSSINVLNSLSRLQTLPEQLLILPNDSPALLNFTRGFSNDNLYRTCFAIRFMSADVALRVLFVKRLLDQLMPLIPHDRRGGIHEFDSYFVNIINDTFAKQKTPVDLLDRAVRVFQTTVAIVRDVPACAPSIRSIFVLAPKLFIPLT